MCIKRIEVYGNSIDFKLVKFKATQENLQVWEKLILLNTGEMAGYGTEKDPLEVP